MMWYIYKKRVTKAVPIVCHRPGCVNYFSLALIAACVHCMCLSVCCAIIDHGFSSSCRWLCLLTNPIYQGNETEHLQCPFCFNWFRCRSLWSCLLPGLVDVHHHVELLHSNCDFFLMIIYWTQKIEEFLNIYKAYDIVKDHTCSRTLKGRF